MKPVSQRFFTLLEGGENLGLYKWNKNIAEHYFCKTCGVYTHHKRRRNPDQIAVNFACLDDLDLPENINIGLVDGASHD
tara:strand:+ start:564 stop:800 length:237 start_codon:yes stop_codon:yes gene_type:complete